MSCFEAVKYAEKVEENSRSQGTRFVVMAGLQPLHPGAISIELSSSNFQRSIPKSPGETSITQMPGSKRYHLSCSKNNLTLLNEHLLDISKNTSAVCIDTAGVKKEIGNNDDGKTAQISYREVSDQPKSRESRIKTTGFLERAVRLCAGNGGLGVDTIDYAKFLLGQDISRRSQSYMYYPVNVCGMKFYINKNFEKSEWRKLFYEHMVDKKEPDFQISNPNVADIELYMVVSRERMNRIIPGISHDAESMSDGGFILYAKNSLVAFKMCKDKNSTNVCNIWVLSNSETGKKKIMKSVSEERYGPIELAVETPTQKLEANVGRFLKEKYGVEWSSLTFTRSATVISKIFQAFFQSNPAIPGVSGVQFDPLQIDRHLTVVAVGSNNGLWLFWIAPSNLAEDKNRVHWCNLSTSHGQSDLFQWQACIEKALNYSTWNSHNPVDDIDRARLLLNVGTEWKHNRTGKYYHITVDEYTFKIKKRFKKTEWRQLFYEHMVNKKEPDFQILNPKKAGIDFCVNLCCEHMSRICPTVTQEAEMMSDEGFMVYAKHSLVALKMCRDGNGTDVCNVWVVGCLDDDERKLLQSTLTST